MSQGGDRPTSREASHRLGDDRLDRSASGLVVSGHGVAGGSGARCPYPEGSLALQAPFFAAAGVELDGFHLGTVNVDLSPAVFAPVSPTVTIADVRWTDRIPPETFSFFRCRLETRSDAQDGWIYRPHPETKVEHHQAPSIVEVIAPWIDGIVVGEVVRVWWSGREARVERG